MFSDQRVQYVLVAMNVKLVKYSEIDPPMGSSHKFRYRCLVAAVYLVGGHLSVSIRIISWEYSRFGI